MIYRGVENDSLLSSLDIAYKNEDYQTFISIAGDQDSLVTAKPSLTLALAISNLERDNFQEAINLFDQLVQNPLYRDQSLWYKGMTFLKQNNLDSAREIFESIVEMDDSTFKDESQKILRHL